MKNHKEEAMRMGAARTKLDTLPVDMTKNQLSVRELQYKHGY